MYMPTAQEIIRSADVVVIKFGSLAVENPDQAFAELTSDVVNYNQKKFFVVASGAVYTGRRIWNGGVELDPQIAAAFGQCLLTARLNTLLLEREIVTGQLLWSERDLEPENLAKMASNMHKVWNAPKPRALMFVNRNNAASSPEDVDGQISNNDTVARLCAVALKAPLIINVTTAVLHDRNPNDPKARLVRRARAADPRLDNMIQDGTSNGGTGGWASKLKEARAAASEGIATLFVKRGSQPLWAVDCGITRSTLLLPGDVDEQIEVDFWPEKHKSGAYFVTDS